MACRSADEGGPGCTWTDADLAPGPEHARPAGGTSPPGLSVRPAGVAPREGQVGLGGGRDRIGRDHRGAGRRAGTQGEEVWEGIEDPKLRDWCLGLDMDLGPEGTRLHRYEAAADRLFRSAWNKLEHLRKERGLPLIQRSAPMPTPEPAPRPPAPPPPAKAPPPRAPACPLPDVSRSSLLGDPSAPVLDIWAAGPPRTGINPGNSSQNKTNPAPGRPANGGRADRRRNLP